MKINKNDVKIALKIIEKYQKRIANAKDDAYHNQKQLAIYWMCTAICEHTNCYMNDGLSKLFNQLHKNGWINFSCQHSDYLRYHFYFTKGSKISLTSAGDKEIQKFTAPQRTSHKVAV